MDYIEYLIKVKQLLRDVERHVNERELHDALSKAVEMSITAREMKNKLHEQIHNGVI
jgi:hypothetical protein